MSLCSSPRHYQHTNIVFRQVISFSISIKKALIYIESILIWHHRFRSGEEAFSRIFYDLERLSLPVYHDMARAIVTFNRGDTAALVSGKSITGIPGAGCTSGHRAIANPERSRDERTEKTKEAMPWVKEALFQTDAS